MLYRRVRRIRQPQHKVRIRGAGPCTTDTLLLYRIIRLANPAHVEAVDLDNDGLMDLIVADLGTPVATDQQSGSVVWLRRTGKRTFEKIVLASRLGRVADVQAADFNGDGKLDLIVADFGRYTAGQLLYLENHSAAGRQ